MFYRLCPDGSRRELDLTGAYAGPARSPCWIIGGGPSLAQLPTGDIAASPAPKFAINLAGHGLLRPDFWTSYDPTARFHRSTYLDASITKFVHRCRAMDLVPGTTFKVCESPATLCFERDPQRGYHDFPVGFAPWKRPEGQTASTGSANTITDWQDSLIQALEIAWRLGFRTMYLAGCEMCIRPSPEQIEQANSLQVTYRDREPLRDFYERCRQRGLTAQALAAEVPPGQYHFDEAKPLAAAVQTDLHYFRVAQSLRLSRQAMALAGLELISVTPESRLNDYFEYRPVDAALEEVHRLVGDPATESTRGMYAPRSPVPAAHLAPMRDLPPHNWTRSPTPPAPAAPPDAARPGRRDRLRQAVADLPEIAVPLAD